MKNFFLVFIVGGMFLNVDVLNDKVENLMGECVYYMNKFFLECLFKNCKVFYVMGCLDFLKLFNIFKENGFLFFNFDKLSMLKIIFKVLSNFLVFVKSINNFLSMMGYLYVLFIKM